MDSQATMNEIHNKLYQANTLYVSYLKSQNNLSEQLTCIIKKIIKLNLQFIRECATIGDSAIANLGLIIKFINDSEIPPDVRDRNINKAGSIQMDAFAQLIRQNRFQEELRKATADLYLNMHGNKNHCCSCGDTDNLVKLDINRIRGENPYMCEDCIKLQKEVYSCDLNKLRI